jgi:hypothetical protein
MSSSGFLGCGLLFCIGLAALPSWAVSGVMLRDDALRASASARGAQLTLAKKGKAVTVLASQGGWTRIQLGKTTGWVRLLSVRRGPASAADLRGSLGSAETAISSPHDSGSITATSGLRGLDLADLSLAKFDARQIELLEGHAVAKADAASFAAQAGLTPRSLAYLPAPAQGVLGDLGIFVGE